MTDQEMADSLMDYSRKFIGDEDIIFVGAVVVGVSKKGMPTAIVTNTGMPELGVQELGREFSRSICERMVAEAMAAAGPDYPKLYEGMRKREDRGDH